MPVEFPNPVEFISAVNINPHDLIDYGRYILPLVRQELARRETTGYDKLADAVDYGRYVLPLVRGELAHRHATGQRGTLQAQHLGNYDPRYGEYATAAGALA